MGRGPSKSSRPGSRCSPITRRGWRRRAPMPYSLSCRRWTPPEGAGDGIWQRRFREINNYERYLSDNGVRIVKLFLNLSREAQRERFVSRIDQPSKNWKFTASDVRERAFWDAYQAAFSDVLSNTSTKWAPWYVVPADNKWFSRLVAAAAIGNALLDIDPDYPTASSETKASLETARRELEAESR